MTMNHRHKPYPQRLAKLWFLLAIVAGGIGAYFIFAMAYFIVLFFNAQGDVEKSQVMTGIVMGGLYALGTVLLFTLLTKPIKHHLTRRSYIVLLMASMLLGGFLLLGEYYLNQS